MAAEAGDLLVSTLAGVKMQVKRVLITGLLIPVFISGVAFWLLYNQTNNKKQWKSPRESSQVVTAGEHTYPLHPHPYISVRAFIMESCRTGSPGGRIPILHRRSLEPSSLGIGTPLNELMRLTNTPT